MARSIRVSFLLGIGVFVACSGPVRQPPPEEPLEEPPAHRPLERRFKYVAVDGALQVYDMDDGYRLEKTIPLPGMFRPRGIAANDVTDRLYLPYWGDRDDPKHGERAGGFGYLMAVDLRTDRVLWTKTFEPSIDSLAITPDGETLFMPSGEERTDSDFWFVLDKDGNEKARVPVYRGTHNTIVGLSGKRAYLASLQYEYLTVIDTSTYAVVKKVGPFGGPIRPFTVNGAETLAVVTTDNLSGFEVGSLETGRVLHRVEVDATRFPWTEPPGPATQSHGVAFTPDEREIWVVDAANRYLHVFDASGLPDGKPRPVADIKLDDSRPDDPLTLPKWINFNHDGRFAHVSTGAILDARSRELVARVAPSRYFLEIGFSNGEPVDAHSRYGLGYAKP